MAIFEVRIIETASRFVEIEADNEADALAMAETLYHEEEIVLDYSDFDDVEFELINK